MTIFPYIGNSSIAVDLSRSSRSQMFFKTGVRKNLANFTGKHLCWSLFAGLKIRKFLIERGSNTGVFL